MPRAISPFTVGDAEEHELAERDPGVHYARVRLDKNFGGDLEGSSSVEMLSVRHESEGAGYVAVERIAGTLHGRPGSFALLHLATMSDDGQTGQWVIVPGSGAGDLTGISGNARIEIDSGAHTFVLDYELGERA